MNNSTAKKLFFLFFTVLGLWVLSLPWFVTTFELKLVLGTCPWEISQLPLNSAYSPKEKISKKRRNLEKHFELIYAMFTRFYLPKLTDTKSVFITTIIIATGTSLQAFSVNTQNYRLHHLLQTLDIQLCKEVTV